MFEVDRIYCSDITGLGVRPFPDLVFEVERILHLKRENAELRMERDILKNATAYFAKESLKGTRS